MLVPASFPILKKSGSFRSSLSSLPTVLVSLESSVQFLPVEWLISKGFTRSLLRCEGFAGEAGFGSSSCRWFASTVGLDLRVGSEFSFAPCSCVLAELLACIDLCFRFKFRLLTRF
jgi:hypothetical protein